MGCSNEMLPVAWGWKISESGLTPIQTDLLPAPEDLLKVIRCGCTADCGIVVCDVAAGKMGLNVLWLAVIGLACQNASVSSISDDEEDSE